MMPAEQVPGLAASAELPAALRLWLSGDDLPTKSGEAIELATVDAEGWPRLAQLGVGEVLALDAQRIAFMLWPQSSAADNLRRTGLATLSLVCAGGVGEIRLRARPQPAARTTLAVFVGTVTACRVQRAPYADVLTGITYRLHEPAAVLARWREQLEILRACA